MYVYSFNLHFLNHSDGMMQLTRVVEWVIQVAQNPVYTKKKKKKKKKFKENRLQPSLVHICQGLSTLQIWICSTLHDLNSSNFNSCDNRTRTDTGITNTVESRKYASLFCMLASGKTGEGTYVRNRDSSV